MSWITMLWSMDAAFCFTLAGIYLLVWSKERDGWVHLLFSCSAVAAGVIACIELISMRTETTAQYEMLLRWAQLPVWLLILSLVWFVRLYFRAGRPWLAWSICGLRTLALILNFVFTPNIIYREITSLRHLSWWGGEIGLGAGGRSKSLGAGWPTQCALAPCFFGGCHHYRLAAWRPATCPRCRRERDLFHHVVARASGAGDLGSYPIAILHQLPVPRDRCGDGL